MESTRVDSGFTAFLFAVRTLLKVGVDVNETVQPGLLSGKKFAQVRAPVLVCSRSPSPMPITNSLSAPIPTPPFPASLASSPVRKMAAITTEGNANPDLGVTATSLARTLANSNATVTLPQGVKRFFVRLV